MQTSVLFFQLWKVIKILQFSHYECLSCIFLENIYGAVCQYTFGKCTYLGRFFFFLSVNLILIDHISKFKWSLNPLSIHCTCIMVAWRNWWIMYDATWEKCHLLNIYECLTYTGKYFVLGNKVIEKWTVIYHLRLFKYICDSSVTLSIS